MFFQTYVQDLIKANPNLIIDCVLSENGHFYVCGDVIMASDVQKAVFHLLKEYLACTYDECQTIIDNMKVHFLNI